MKISVNPLKSRVCEWFNDENLVRRSENPGYTDYLKEHSVQISMDGKGRWADNIMIERWFRSLKYDEVYLNEYKNLRDARAKIADYITTYNWTRHHSAVGYKSPASVYHKIEDEAA